MMKINVKTTNNYFERTETLVKYYHEVNDYEVVDATREKELFTLLNEGKKNYEKAKQAGDEALARKYEKEVKRIRDFIINSNLRFVLSVARIYAKNRNLSDIIDEGNIGLVKAVDTFDVTLGNRFQTHAIYLIRQQINIFRQNDGLMIKKNNESKTYHIIRNMTNKFMQEFQTHLAQTLQHKNHTLKFLFMLKLKTQQPAFHYCLAHLKLQRLKAFKQTEIGNSFHSL